MAAILQGGLRDTLYTNGSGVINKFAITNHAVRHSWDENANDDLVTAEILGTLIQELIQKGIINGTVA